MARHHGACQVRQRSIAGDGYADENRAPSNFDKFRRMSIRAMNWAWAQKIPPTPKLILMALADAANHADECWPGIPFVAEKCCVSERTVQRVVREFEAIKLMSVSERFTTTGRRTSNIYHLHIDLENCPDNLTPSKDFKKKRGAILSESRATLDVTDDGDNAVSPPEPPKESKQQPLQFPLKLSVAEKLAIAEQIATIFPEDAQAMLDELADAMATGSIKTNPLRWFRGLVTKQKAGVFIPSGGIRIMEHRRRKLLEETLPIPEVARTTSREVARASLQKAMLLISNCSAPPRSIRSPSAERGALEEESAGATRPIASGTVIRPADNAGNKLK